MPRSEPVLRVADLAVKAAVLALLGVALAFPHWERFADKAMAGRAVAYPLGLLLVPVGWLVARRTRRAPYPWAADLLVSLPWLVDLAGNAVDAFDTLSWFDDAAHLVNWALLFGAVALLLPRSLPVWVRLLLGAGCGCLSALGWELAEYATFIRGGAEESTAYRDTLGDLSLGTLGALLSSVLVAGLRGRRGPAPRVSPALR